MSPDLVGYSWISGSTVGSMPSALVTRFLCAAFFACSGVMMPESICSCSSEWSRDGKFKQVTRDQHLVVVVQAHDQRGAHAGVLRLALRRLVDRRVRLEHLLAHHLSH